MTHDTFNACIKSILYVKKNFIRMSGTKLFSQKERTNSFRDCRWSRQEWKKIQNGEWIIPVDEIIVHLLSLRLNSHVKFSTEWHYFVFDAQHWTSSTYISVIQIQMHIQKYQNYVVLFNCPKKPTFFGTPLLWNACKRIDKTTKIIFMNIVLCHANRVKRMNICNGMRSVCQLGGHSHNEVKIEEEIL